MIGRPRVLFCIATIVLVAQVASGATEKRSALPDAEKQKIEALLLAVKNLDGAVFVRNGKAYPPATAVKFLRGKWDKQSAQITTAEDFIAKAATSSSTTGRPYLVRFSDGREVPTATFLRSQLAALR